MEYNVIYFGGEVMENWKKELLKEVLVRVLDLAKEMVKKL